MINTPYKQLEKGDNRIHPGMQFLIFIFIFLALLIIGNLIGAAMITSLYGVKTLMALGSLNTATPHFNNALWILQIVGTTAPIFAAPVFFAYVIVRNPADYIKPGFRFPIGLLFLVLLIMLLSNPMIEILSNINQKLQLPPALKGVQDWMKDSEKSAQQITDYMLQMKNVWDLILNVLLIGLLTAIVEEFMFRGALQTILVRWTKNVHAAIWITAILFSAFHMEFFGFLPRLLLGVLFGYFVAWSGSIWTSVWAHFLNNGTAVVVTYLFQHKQIKMNPDDQHVFNYTAYIFSTVILLLLLFIYGKVAVEKPIIPEEQ